MKGREDLSIRIDFDLSRGPDHVVAAIGDGIAKVVREAGRREARAVEQMRSMRLADKARDRREQMARMRRKVRK